MAGVLSTSLTQTTGARRKFQLDFQKSPRCCCSDRGLVCATTTTFRSAQTSVALRQFHTTLIGLAVGAITLPGMFVRHENILEKLCAWDCYGAGYVSRGLFRYARHHERVNVKMKGRRSSAKLPRLMDTTPVLDENNVTVVLRNHSDAAGSVLSIKERSNAQAGDFIAMKEMHVQSA